ncbi:MAG: hypothetical protein CME61_02135 [Halobacteriovoraceae bacterium]|nr:hypothetical protein [Halobacteriovoraceae bacterium]
MAQKKLSKEDEKKEKARFIQKRYADSITVLRLAREYNQKKDVANAVKAYVKYIDALLKYFEVNEENLSPLIFKKEENIHEIMLISQVYWDLAKAYDRSEKLKEECKRCLNKFVEFSVGFKFQYLNSEILRKHLKKGTARNTKDFEAAFKKINLSSNKCYIATYCFGDESSEVATLRKFKFSIQANFFGYLFIRYYYQFSPKLINLCSKSVFAKNILLTFSKPLLTSFSKFLLFSKMIK